MKQKQQARKYEFLPINEVRPDPNQPRKTFDPQKLEELQLSMKEHGMEQPIQVKKAKDGKYDIIAGERRWKCAKALGWKGIEAEIKQANINAFKWALIENMVREDLNPMDKAEAIARLKNEEGMSTEDISRCLGKDDNGYFVSSHLRLLQLPDNLKTEVRKETLSETVALTFVRRTAGQGRRRADPVEIKKHFDAVCDRVHGRTKLTASIVEAYFDEIGREKERRAPRKRMTDAEFVRTPSERTARRNDREKREADESPLPAIIRSGTEFLGLLDFLIGSGVKPADFRARWNALPKAQRKELSQLMEMLQGRSKRFNFLTRTNGEDARA